MLDRRPRYTTGRGEASFCWLKVCAVIAWLERFGTAPMWMSPMYPPLTPGFFSIVAGFFVIVLTLRSVRYAYESLGVSSNTAILLLFATLIGSFFNIPITELPPERAISHHVVDFFGMRYALPVVSHWKGTVVAVNVGGA